MNPRIGEVLRDVNTGMTMLVAMSMIRVSCLAPTVMMIIIMVVMMIMLMVMIIIVMMTLMMIEMLCLIKLSIHSFNHLYAFSQLSINLSIYICIPCKLVTKVFQDFTSSLIGSENESCTTSTSLV